MFEPIGGSAPKYTGMNKVNPMAQILSGMMMLRHLGETVLAFRTPTPHSTAPDPA